MGFSDNITLGKLLDRTAAIYPDNEALVYPDRGLRYSYTELQEECNKFAKGLLKLSVKRGDNVAIWATNIPEWVITQYGSAKIGAVLVTVNTHFKSFELENQLKQSDATTLVLMEGTKSSSYKSMIYELCPELHHCNPGELISKKLPFLKNVIMIGDEGCPGMFTWDDVIKMAQSVSDEKLSARMAELNPKDVIHMVYTSGTTGIPKGVMLTHYNIINNAIGMAEGMKLDHTDRLCIPVPFFHCFGCVAGTLCCVVAGATMIPVEIFKAEKVLNTIEKERCTAVLGTPTMFLMELELYEKSFFNTASLRTGMVAGAACPSEVIKKIINIMNIPQIVVAYGQTEASPCMTYTRADDSLELKLSTVGRALPGVEMKIFDPETGQEVPPGVQGELRARGYNIMRGYYKMSEETAAAIDKDGWLHTGDLGIMTENGYCTITCRIKDMIIRGGENIYPREIENFLSSHPAINNVQVIGIPSSKYGEKVMAYIQLKAGPILTPEEVRIFCKGKIASVKIPEYVAFVDSFPLSGSGKILKHKLREMFSESIQCQ